MDEQQSLRLMIHGHVQGVGFRPFVFRLAQAGKLRGWVQNTGEGVVVEVGGSREALHHFVKGMEQDKPAAARIESIKMECTGQLDLPDFHIKASRPSPITTSIPLDVSLCDACRAELLAPGNRRFRYPFITCSTCGPRFTILQALPFDRAQTSMKAFALCPECLAEYHDPHDRRFHAQTISCPACGPTLSLVPNKRGQRCQQFAAIAEAAKLLSQGATLAIKGLGGYHIAVDAHHETAVRRLRERKQRPDKPFAVMFPGLDQLRTFSHPTQREIEWLSGPVAPIVLLERRQHQNLAPSISAAAPLLGAMLPHTPLHLLLLQAFGGPLLMTSGNRAEGPIITSDAIAQQQLGPLVDGFLIHNRPIAHHADDSIIRVWDQGTIVMRLGRGLAPLKINRGKGTGGLVALGAHQKNSFAVLQKDGLLVSQEMGRLDIWDNRQRFEKEMQAYLQILNIEARAFIHDQHPDYGSTQIARARSEGSTAIQHHAAHIMAAAAEQKIQDEVLGLAWDGWGLGEDGSMWGGECFRLDGRTSRPQRIGSFHPFPVLGGDRAAREPWRSAVGVAKVLFGEEAAEQLHAFHAAACLEAHDFAKVVLALPSSCSGSVLTSSVGRLFDAVASLLHVKQLCSFEGQAAMLLEAAAHRSASYSPYSLEVREHEGIFEIDWRPGLLELLEEHRRGQTPGIIAARFHQMLILAVEKWIALTGLRQVLVSGGVFQNRFLLDTLSRRLQALDIELLMPQTLPVHDGSICVGQMLSALNLRSVKDVPGYSRPHYND